MSKGQSLENNGLLASNLALPQSICPKVLKGLALSFAPSVKYDFQSSFVNVWMDYFYQDRGTHKFGCCG
jgi:hypothetical protein